jgi:hypothetical protein
LKIGLPKLRLSRKLLIITLGITVLLGGTSAAALYFKGVELGLEGAENTIGGECTDVQTMVLKTPANRLWLRRFIRMEKASGPDRVRTALRVAGLLAKKNAVDLIHVSVLDSHGPTLRAQMRARSIGAEVLIAMKPDNLPEMKSPAMASYYEGPVSNEGRYYGDKVVVDIDEIGAMMTAMRSIEEKPDCIGLEKAEDAGTKSNDHGKKDAKSSDHGKNEEQEAKPSEDHGEKQAEDHGEQPAKEGAEDHTNAEAPAEEQSLFDSMLSMVGLGGGEKPAADHSPATDNSHAVAEEPADGALDEQGDQAAGEHDAKPAHESEKAATEGHEPAAKTEGHGAVEKPADAAADVHAEKPAVEHDAKAADHAAETSTKDHEPAEKADGHTTAEEPATSHEAAEETKVQPVTESHGGKEAQTEHAEPADKAQAHDAPAKDHSATPAEAEDHAQPKKKADEHAEAYMPVGD